MKENLKHILTIIVGAIVSLTLIGAPTLLMSRRAEKLRVSRYKAIGATLFDSGAGTITTVTHDGHKLIVANFAYKSVSIIHHPDCCK